MKKLKLLSAILAIATLATPFAGAMWSFNMQPFNRYTSNNNNSGFTGQPPIGFWQLPPSGFGATNNNPAEPSVTPGEANSMHENDARETLTYDPDDERLLNDFFSPLDRFPGGKYYEVPKAKLAEIAKNAATNAEMVEEQREKERLEKIRPEGWQPEIDRLPTGRKANRLLERHFYNAYYVDKVTVSFSGESADPFNPRFIYSNLRAYVWDKYVKGEIEELPADIVELRNRQLAEMYDDEDEREGPDEIEEEVQVPTSSLPQGSAMPSFGYSYNGM